MLSINSLFEDLSSKVEALDKSLEEKTNTRKRKAPVATVTKETKKTPSSSIPPSEAPPSKKKVKKAKKEEAVKKTVTLKEAYNSFWEEFSSGDKEAQSEKVYIDDIYIRFFVREAPRIEFGYKSFSLEWLLVKNRGVLIEQMEDLRSTHKFYGLDGKEYHKNLDKVIEELRKL